MGGEGSRHASAAHLTELYRDGFSPMTLLMSQS
jgi:hypothetical protein